MTPEEQAQLAQIEAAIRAKEESIAQLEAMPTSAPIPSLSLLDRAKAGLPYLGGPFAPLVKAGLDVVENPRPVIEEGTSIAGSVAGGAAGTKLGLALAPFTYGLSVPVGAIAGGALGSYADVPIQMGLDYLTGTTPKQSRFDQATEEAVLGAGLETALRGTGFLGRYALPVARKAASWYDNLIGPQTAVEAERLVGAQLPGIMVGQETAQSAVGQALAREQLAQAAAEKEALVQAGVPASTLTTPQLTGSQQLARTEALVSDQALGQANDIIAANASKQLDEINAAAESLTALKDPNPKRAGEAARSLLESAREKARTEAGAKFTDDVRSITAPIEGIAKDAKSAFKSIFQDTKVLTPSGELGDLYEKVRKLEAAAPTEKAAVGFGRQAPKAAEKPTTTTVGMLQDMRSKALELAREAGDGSREELFANRLVELLGKRIDNVKGTEALVEARNSWRQFKQRWYRSEDGQQAPLAKLLRKQNPEDIITSVSKKSAVSDEYAKVVDDLEPNKLATEMADFVQQKTVGQKLDWLRSKRAVYADSPIASTIDQWEGVLKRIQASGKSANLRGLSAENIDTQAKALIRALGGTGREAVTSGAEAGTLSAGRNIGRSALTATLGKVGFGPLMSFGLPLYTSRVQKSTGQVASALAQALTDPATALKYVDDAAKYGKEVAEQRLKQDQVAKGLVSAVESFAPRAGAFARSSGMISNPVEYAATTPLPETEADIAAEIAAIQEALEAEKARLAATETPAPEPTKEPTPTVQVGKQNISIPTGEKYAPASLVKAVMKVESGGKQEAVSSKGARGLMQLMPATARDLGVDASKPDENVEGGSRYLAQQLSEFGDESLALAAYNWGPNNIKRAMAKVRAEGKRPTWANIKAYVKVPKETREYVDKVLSLI